MLTNRLCDALRSLRRIPGSALLTAGTLAIDVGLNTVNFTVLDCVLLRPLGYGDPNSIVSA